MELGLLVKVAHEVSERVVMRWWETFQCNFHHLQTLLVRTHPYGDETQVIHIKCHEWNRQFTKIQLHCTSQRMDVFKLGQVSTHVCRGTSWLGSCDCM